MAQEGPNLNETHELYVHLKAGLKAGKSFSGYAMAALRLRLPERTTDEQDGSIYRYFEKVGLNIVVDSALLTDMKATGGDVWHGSHALGLYLQGQPDIVAGKRVLELGSGTGFLGLVAAAVGAEEVLVSDRAVMVPLMQANIDRNEAIVGTKAKAVELDWCKDVDAQLSAATAGRPIESLLGADLLYQFAEKVSGHAYV
jgi:hypothetical protein